MNVFTVVVDYMSVLVTDIGDTILIVLSESKLSKSKIPKPLSSQ